MKQFFVRNKTVIFTIIVAVLILMSLMPVLINKSYAEDLTNTHCRQKHWTGPNGKECYSCYVAESPPYWGCIYCPWKTC